MELDNLKLNRNYGYDIIINNFEPLLRSYIINEVFLINYGKDWQKNIPNGVINELKETKDYRLTDETSIDDFFEELNFLNLKDIIVFSKNYSLTKSFLGELNKEKFIELMDDLNLYRRKIAHARSTFSNYDLTRVVENLELLCQGESAKSIITYINNKEYKNAKPVPDEFYQDYDCQHNLPSESYDLEGGFVGREKEIRALKKLLKSDQDRIITITGAGGVGKTAIALKVAYSFLSNPENSFEAIIWFSAKMSKLTDEGIVPLEPAIKDDRQLILDLLKIIDSPTLLKFQNANVPLESYRTHINNIFSSQKCLVIIDNLETVLEDNALVAFIKDIPRPSQVLITSRKGIGEIERRYPITDMPEKDAILMFRLVAKERNRQDLLRLSENKISELVKRVKCYPLLIKWSIGQVCLGKDIDKAFSEIFDGESEIAKFSFNDVFSLLSQHSKLILFSMIVIGDRPVSRYELMYLTNINDDQFTDAIKELLMCSFIFTEVKEVAAETGTNFSMLTLTRGFIEFKLDEDIKTREMIMTRYYHITEQIKELEKAKSSYSQSLFSLGIKTPEEKIAFDYVKAAKNFFYKGDIDSAETNFDEALKIAPKFSYALIEYSKYEFARNHRDRALELASEAVKTNPENFHAWFSYGISLRKAGQFPEAISSLKKAKELNQQHLPIFNELGRAYTFNGNYELADTEFNEALKEEKYPNYRHKIMTFQFMADNFKRWSEEFRMRYDSTNEINKLKKAYTTIVQAKKINENDRKLLNIYRDICLEIGKTLIRNRDFNTAELYLKQCLETVIPPEMNMVAEASFYLAVCYARDREPDLKQTSYYINLGLKNSLIGSKMFDNLEAIKKKYLEEQPMQIKNGRQYGRIKFYNGLKKFGVIKTTNDNYIFLQNGLNKNTILNKFEDYFGQSVSFLLVKSENEKHPLIATDIIITQDK